MPTEEQMTVNERRKYVKLMKPLYQQAKRGERSRLLTQMQEVTRLHRKSLLRLLHAKSLNLKKRTTPRKRTYGPEVEQQLAQISEATVTRLLRKHRSRKQRLPRKGPERANQVRKEVPMKRLAWDITEPGHFEVDLVHHGGENTAGEYGHTIQLIDVTTGWSERVAVLGRGQTAMEGGFRRILERIPFAILELHPDNGSEFFNQHLVRFWKDKVTGVQLSRSRPYHKNDNRFVEQKNSSLVRQYFGTLRLDTLEQVAAMNGLYEQMWLYYNLFQPVLHLKEKRVEPDGIVRTWDMAQTPYQRLRASGRLSHEQQAHLQALYEQTNPLRLRQAIYQGLAALWDSYAACALGAA